MVRPRLEVLLGRGCLRSGCLDESRANSSTVPRCSDADPIPECSRLALTHRLFARLHDQRQLRLSGSGTPWVSRPLRCPMDHVADSAGQVMERPLGLDRVHGPRRLGSLGRGLVPRRRAKGLFLQGLLSETVVVLGRMVKDRILAGGIVNRSAGAAGISNVFSEAGHGSETWSALAQCARASFPNLPLIGYERGETLADAQNSGFQAVGSLKVWLADT
jgi:hypothetical protein